ncbi:hypothetical protein Dsin_003718 [Dipteronia sinensis]|uniref:Uncharacterized protein n=1 Tax=Dipteronia sinensis TaxID=43782 RepID=A0AAE0B9N7_9ROSI|nr:hypothetical protein Dsin_003718 [Dipteronia sinensis]
MNVDDIALLCNALSIKEKEALTPWTFDRAMIIFEEPQGSRDNLNMVFNKSSQAWFPWRTSKDLETSETSAWKAADNGIVTGESTWMCIGDFNEILLDSEKEGGADRKQVLMDNFRHTLDHCRLEDLGFSCRKFTYSNKRKGLDHIQERIDRGVCCYRWNQLFLLSRKIVCDKM